ncbi:MAG TPA: lysine 2,3-aminomutase, partial [Xanthobacteraceae bacterium]
MDGHTLRTSEQLADAGLIRRGDVEALADVAARYAVAITPAMADLVDAADPHDPIARQFVPDAAELATRAEERADPIG